MAKIKVDESFKAKYIDKKRKPKVYEFSIKRAYEAYWSGDRPSSIFKVFVADHKYNAWDAASGFRTAKAAQVWANKFIF